jgi:UDP-N-acetylglucosamine acyltransferase
MIHPTALVSPNAEIGSDVEIGPYTIIGDHVTIGSNAVIGPHVTIDPFVEIGQECHIFQFASIGALPQAIKFQGEETYVKIGRKTIVREFATINRGTGFGGGITEVGEENLLMAYTHIAHDCKTGRGVILANNATLAGHITIEDYATVGGLTALHQFVRVGKHAYIGGKSAVVKDVPPFVIAAGDRAKLHGLNRVGLKRHGFSADTIAMLKKTYRLIFRIGLTLNEAIERVRAEVDGTPEVDYLLDFIKASERGMTR